MKSTTSATLAETVQYSGIQHSEFSLGCQCAMCTGGLDPNIGVSISDPGAYVGVLEASVDRFAGTTAANGKAIWSADQAASHLNRTGGGWGDEGNHLLPRGGDANVITFGFHEDQDSLERNGYVYTNPENGQLTAFAEYFNFASFNEAQRNATRQAIGFWDDAVAVTFRETGADQGDINFGNLASAPQTQAYARIPTAGFGPGGNIAEYYGDQIAGLAGDVWVSASQASNFQLKPGGYGLNTLTHETGHAIGLSHPGNYNFGPGFAVNYANGAEYFQDARNYTIMSYWNPRDIGAQDFNWNTMSLAYGGTPMVHDILAAQKIYGVDTTTRTGDTVYGFNSNAGKDVFDFTINKAPTVAIWDAGGNDTLDVSGYRTDQEINLNPGSLSSIGGVTYAEALERLSFEQVNANRAAMGFAPTTRATYDANLAVLAANNSRGRLTDNVGIAYGAIIENAVGGSGNDRLIGNAVANVLDGGAGFDTASYRDASGSVTASLASMRGTAGDAAGDRYVNIEALEGGAFNDTLTGSTRDDTLWGLGGNDTLDGSTGSDTLWGGDGDDTLRGSTGNDTLDGGTGNDVLDGGTGNDVLDGGAGNDTLDGGTGNDVLRGGAGNDVLIGGTGDDVLDGGIGNDVMTGGTGADIFRFADLGGTDTIADFRRGQDRIDLSGLDAITGGSRDAFSFVGGSAFGNVAGELRSYSANGAFFLAGDVNGDGVADFVIQTSVAVTQADLILG